MAQSNPSIVTEEVLKREKGEFSLESIFILDYSCRGIVTLGCITKCLNLQILDISSNHLSSVGELALLSALEHLDLSNNNISQLDGLHKLENLSRLELAGNEISSFDAFTPLSSLCKLDRLTLQLSQHSKLSNPICRHKDYHTTMLEIFPVLVWLDREMVCDDRQGRTFYRECRNIQDRQISQDALTEAGKNFEASDLVDPFQEGDKASDGEERTKKLLAECRESSRKVQKFLDDVRSELNLSRSLATEH